MDFGYDDTLQDTLADLPTCAPAIFFDTETTGATGTEINQEIMIQILIEKILA